VTKYRMSSWGYSGNVLYLFCHACHESQEHLFFQCGFSLRIWQTLMSACLFTEVPSDWDKFVTWCVGKL
jgi:hypothetical protein